jgi:hypothetical protein
MSATTRVNGFAQYTTGTLRTVAQLKAFVIAVQNASNTAIDLQSLDDGADEMVEAIIREVQPLMYYVPSDSSGLIHVIVDGHAVDATSLQERVVNVVIGQGSYGTAATNDTTVTLGSAIVVS